MKYQRLTNLIEKRMQREVIIWEHDDGINPPIVYLWSKDLGWYPWMALRRLTMRELDNPKVAF